MAADDWAFDDEEVKAKEKKKEQKKLDKKNGSPTRKERMERGVSGRPDQVKDQRKAVKGGKDRKERAYHYRKQNDPAWYAKSPEMMQAAASINFYQLQGSPIHEPLPSVGSVDVSTGMPLESVPGVMVLRYAPTIGFSNSPTSAASIAARALYSDIWSHLGGRTNYMAPNLMMYVIAAANAYAYLVWMRRLYTTIRLYSAQNRYFPAALIKAMGVDTEDIKDKGFSLYYYMNEYQTKLSAFCFPSGMPFFDRYLFMNEGYWLDTPMAKSQVYMFNPLYFFYYDETSTPGKGNLLAQALGKYDGTPGDMTFTDIVKIGNKLVGALSDSEDCYIMSGDILKVYGESVFKLDVMPLDAAPNVDYNVGVLEQIHNATVLGVTGLPDGISVTEDVNTGALLSSLTWGWSKYLYNSGAIKNNLGNTDRMFSFASDSPPPDMVMEASRLMCSAYYSGAGVVVLSSGTEVIANAEIIVYHNNSGKWELDTIPGLAYAMVFPQGTGTGSYTDWMGTRGNMSISAVSRFAAHPRFRCVSYAMSGSNVSAVRGLFDLWDVDNVTTITMVQLDRMHETALLSMFDVPDMLITTKR